MTPFLERLILACLAKRPEDRPADAGVVLQELEEGWTGPLDAAGGPRVVGDAAPAMLAERRAAERACRGPQARREGVEPRAERQSLPELSLELSLEKEGGGTVVSKEPGAGKRLRPEPTGLHRTLTGRTGILAGRSNPPLSRQDPRVQEPRLKLRVLVSMVAVVAVSRVASPQVPLGPEFQVNTYTRYNQMRPAVATDASGNFVVVWQTFGQDGGGGYGGGASVVLRRFLASGAPLSAEARVNSYTTGSQFFPAVASAPTGRFVVVWDSWGRTAADYGVFGRRYDDAGAPGPEFRVNTYTTGYQFVPAVAMDASGNFVVVWEGWAQDGGYPGIFGQRYDAAGAPQGPEFRVNSYTTGFQRYPSVGMDATGNFVVAWVDEQQEGDPGIFAQRYDAAGVPQGGEFRVHSYVTSTQTTRPWP